MTELFVSFLLIGLGAYGGGLVTVPLIQHELVVVRGWLGVTDMARIVAIAQMTPGPIAVNAATFVGYRVGGIPGALVATTAIVLPSVVLMTLVTLLHAHVAEVPRFRAFRRGIRLGVVGLLLHATVAYGGGVATTPSAVALAAAAFGLMVVLDGKVHPIVVVLAAGLAGLAGV